MIAKLRAHLAHNVVGYLALFIALGGSSYAAVKVGSRQIVNNSVRSADIRDNDIRGKDIRNGSIQGVDIARGTLSATNFAAGQLPTGLQGPAGPRGPSFGDGQKVPNVSDIACDTDVVVGSQAFTVPETSRIWVYGQGAFRQGGSPKDEFGLRVRLRSAANTTPLASSVEAWDAKTGAGDADTVLPLSTGGILLTGDAQPTGPAYVAAPGSYVLELVAIAQSGAPCTTNFPDFGYNQGSAMGYVLLGTG